MAKKVLEKTITNNILKYLKSLPDCLAKKRTGGINNRSEPDIFGCIAGRHFELEVKRPGGRLTPNQAATLKRWKEAGAVTGVPQSVEDVQALFSEKGLI